MIARPKMSQDEWNTTEIRAWQSWPTSHPFPAQVWFGGHVVSSLTSVPYLIDPGFKSRKVRRIEHDRSKSSSYLQTLKLREHGDDPEAQCASSFDYMRDAVHRGHHKSAGGHR